MSAPEPMRDLQARVAAHHLAQFGRVPLLLRAAKLGEESGEVLGAVVRHVQGRDGRSWHPEIEAEIGDVYVVLLGLADLLGLSLEDIGLAAAERFLARTWNHGPQAGCGS